MQGGRPPRSDPAFAPHQAAVRRVTSRCPSQWVPQAARLHCGPEGRSALTGPRPHTRGRGSASPTGPPTVPEPCPSLSVGTTFPAPGPWGSFQSLSPLKCRGRRWTSLLGAGLGIWERARSEVSPDTAELLTRKPEGRCQNFKSVFWLTFPLLLWVSST